MITADFVKSLATLEDAIVWIAQQNQYLWAEEKLRQEDVSTKWVWILEEEYDRLLEQHNTRQHGWDLEGQRVAGLYLGTIPVKGIVESSRVALGGRVKHILMLEQDLDSSIRCVPKGKSVILNASEVTAVL